MKEIDEVSKKREVNMIKNPDKWPLMYLPMKKRAKKIGDFPDFGTIFEGQPTTIYKVYEELTHGKPIDFKTAPKIEYPSVEALVDDGWVVD